MADAGRHESHDPLLIAALAAGDLAADERREADHLVAACPDCAGLAADLVAIARVTAELPASQRPRDFFVSAADARRLRRRSFGRRFRWATSGDELGRPLAAGLMAIGLAGILFAAMPNALPGSAPGSADLRFTGASPSPDTLLEIAGGDARQSTSPAPSPGSQAFPTPGGSAGSPEVAGGAPAPLLIASVASFLLGGSLYVALDLRRGRRPA